MNQPRRDAMNEAREVLNELARFLAKVDSQSVSAHEDDAIPSEFPRRMRMLAMEMSVIVNDEFAVDAMPQKSKFGVRSC